MGFYQNMFGSLMNTAQISASLGATMSDREIEQKFKDKGYEAELAAQENANISDIINKETDPSKIKVESPLGVEMPFSSVEADIKERTSGDYTKTKQYRNAKRQYDEQIDAIRTEYQGTEYTIKELESRMRANKRIIDNYEDLRLKRQYHQESKEITDALLISGILRGGRV